MNRAEVPVLESTLQKTHLWLKELSELMGWDNQQLAYLAFRAVLHALRDRLPVEITAKFGAQLPLLIRGIYYEGWVPAHTPLKIHQAEDFSNLVAGYLNNDILIPQTRFIIKNVFKVIENHVSEGEMNHLRKVLPEPIISLWY